MGRLAVSLASAGLQTEQNQIRSRSRLKDSGNNDFKRYRLSASTIKYPFINLRWVGHVFQLYLCHGYTGVQVNASLRQ